MHSITNSFPDDNIILLSSVLLLFFTGYERIHKLIDNLHPDYSYATPSLRFVRQKVDTL